MQGTKVLSNQDLEALAAQGGNLTALVEEVRALRVQQVTSVTTPPASPLRPGNNVLIRTVTFFHVGRVESVTDSEILLSQASWVADTGRFHTALRTGALNEIEPFVGPVSINRGVVVDVADWTHLLPTEQK